MADASDNNPPATETGNGDVPVPQGDGVDPVRQQLEREKNEQQRIIAENQARHNDRMVEREIAFGQRLTEEWEKVEKELQTEREEKVTLERKVTALEAEIGNKTTEINNLTNTLKEQTTIDKFQKALKEKQDAFDTAVNGMKKDFEERLQGPKLNKCDVEMLRSELVSVKKQLEEANGQLLEQSTKKETWKKKQKEHLEAPYLTQMKLLNENHQEALRKMQTEVDDWKRSVDRKDEQHRAEIQRIQAEYDGFRTNILASANENKGELAQCKSERKDFEKKVESLKKESESKEGKVEELEGKVAEQGKQIETLKLDLEKSRQSYRDLIKQQVDVENEARGRIKELDDKNYELETELRNKKDEVENLERKVRILQKKN